MLASYLLVTLAIVVTPGAATAVVVRNTLAGSRATGFATAAGVAFANVLQALIVGIGVAVLIARWPSGFAVIRLAGGAYLAWLGLVSVWRALTRADGGLPAPAETNTAAGEHHRYLIEGLTVNLLNPSITTFYLVVVPSFIPPAASRLYYVGLAALHVAIAFACHSLWIVALDRVRRVFRQPSARRTLGAVSGVALIGLAARIFLQ